MAIVAYPAGSKSGFSEESEFNSERDRLIYALGGRLANFIVDPFTGNHFGLTTSGTSLDVTVEAGDAFTGGHLIRSDAGVTKTISASTTSELFLVVRDSATGNAEIIAQDKGTADPTGQYVVKLWEATTDTGGVTGTTDFRPYVAYREDAVETSITGNKAGVSGTIAVDTLGVKTVPVSFTNAYQTAVDDVQVTLNALGDTAVDFGYIRIDPTSISPTGFTIEAKVNTAGATGTTADFRWNSMGQ